MERIHLKRARLRARGVLLSLVTLLSSFAVTACGSGNGAAGGSADLSSPGLADGLRRTLPSADEVAKSSDYLKVAVKYVSYRDSNGTVVADEPSVRDMLARTTSVWAQCNIGLELTQYDVVEPDSSGLSYNPGTYSEIDRARMKFQDDRHLLIMGTGSWGRNANLGSANCYSSFPGDDADGIICESRTAVSGMVISHEIGHWLYLTHTGPDSNLMDPLVGPSDDAITDAQCERARRTIGEFRRNAVL